MFGSHNFHGSTTVGERGQIVLPAKLREELGISPGDKLLVLSAGSTGKEMIMIMRAEVLNEIVRRMSRNFQQIMDNASSEANDAGKGE